MARPQAACAHVANYRSIFNVEIGQASVDRLRKVEELCQIEIWDMVMEGLLLHSILVKYICFWHCFWIFKCVLDFVFSVSQGFIDLAISMQFHSRYLNMWLIL